MDLVGVVVPGIIAGSKQLVYAVFSILLLFSRNPTRPPSLVLALCGFFVLTVGAPSVSKG